MNRKERGVRKLILALLLGLFATSLIGCMRPEPQRPPEVIEETDKTIKEPWQEKLPGE
jgi:hypothetical protein